MTRVAELVGVLAMATDLGLGLPIEHAIRACLMAVEFGRRLGMPASALSDLYYLTLLRMLGCTSGSSDAAYFFDDEVAFGRDTQHLDYGDSSAFRTWVMRSYAVDRSAEERDQLLARLFSYTPEKRPSALRGHCEVAQMLATRLGFRGTVVEGVAMVFERWDGTGVPNGIRGADMPVAVRLMHLCNELETHSRLGGRDAAVAMAQERSGTAFEPALVSASCSDPDVVLDAVGPTALWEHLMAAEPDPHLRATEKTLVEAARVMGDSADLKSSYLAGHSASVAALSAAAAEQLKLDQEECAILRIAALAHDLERVATSAAVWDKPGPLNDADVFCRCSTSLNLRRAQHLGRLLLASSFERSQSHWRQRTRRIGGVGLEDLAHQQSHPAHALDLASDVDLIKARKILDRPLNVFPLQRQEFTLA